ncbi:MAG TPA: alpha/beta hydrolase [Blastocatellia bacterium]|nr:alpha/beta hydrolase [Blastocatellia bacterium]
MIRHQIAPQSKIQNLKSKIGVIQNLKSKIVLALMLVAAATSVDLVVYAHPEHESSTLDAASHFASLDGSRVHYKSYGKGREALVFVHGWCCNLDFWSGQTPAFESKTRVIALDLPGHGMSDKPQIAYTMDLFARAVEAVLRDAGVDRAVLVGHSMGTPVIRQFYRKYPARTLGLVIVDGPLRPFGDTATVDKFIAPLRGPNYKEVAATFIDGMMGPQVSATLREQIKTAMLSAPQHVVVGAMESMNNPSIWKEDKIEVPVLAIMAKSAFLPADSEQSYRSLAPNLDYQMWSGVTHFLMMEKPKEFNEALATFLQKNKLLKRI